ncbi:Uncharacterised protein [Mycobacterium tuberculosis]|nr:Uncharacterised protein [Mycobacterium tuberculosis]
MHGLQVIGAIARSRYTRLISILVALAVLVSLNGGSSVSTPSVVAAGIVKTPKQHGGSAQGKPHQVGVSQTAAKADKKRRMPKRPKGAPALEKPFKPQVVTKTDAKRPNPPRVRDPS